ncbi:hypothetical protein A3D03_04625 [Candidatus Gottesmanbacteria bacterium RIFCSPHIGHO2_02_FULL_40_13]|uniref:Soluble ligand binding domain-containing protein n=1 Tax=Candidatus Gottesmanbacteria bacterium RIFCSPHIGHO2_02_FULL_40_13 TaxID=1798384 RepID=A0A1F6ABW7_9BACT|nr:MAG: hypothetical protein A3D03_04625 [Candidatus Gottesmanbacteria bacterium RIFCSPHIGHO2_02_FULL_40_13]
MAEYLESDNLPGNSFADIPRVISLYKIPLILTAVGIILFIAVIVLQIKANSNTPDVVFETATGSTRLKIAFDIEGAVEKPGLYQLDEGTRVDDILILAGGFSANADREWAEKSLNRAAKLIDGGKIYIPSVDEISSGKVLSNLRNPSNLLGITTGNININTASQSELESLPGVGPATALKIISGRPYMSLDELKSKKIAGNALYEKIKEMISI